MICATKIIFSAIVANMMMTEFHRNGIIERMNQAETLEEKKLIVRETETYAFKIADEVFKPDEEIGEEGIQVKKDFIKALICSNYQFFGLPTPFEEGETFEDIEFRSGLLKDFLQ